MIWVLLFCLAFPEMGSPLALIFDYIKSNADQYKSPELNYVATAEFMEVNSG